MSASRGILASLPSVCKKYQNWWKFDKVPTKTNLHSFFETRCRHSLNFVPSTTYEMHQNAAFPWKNSKFSGEEVSSRPPHPPSSMLYYWCLSSEINSWVRAWFAALMTNRHYPLLLPLADYLIIHYSVATPLVFKPFNFYHSISWSWVLPSVTLIHLGYIRRSRWH